MMKIIYFTASSKEEVDNIAKTLVEEELSACVNILGEINSIYKWEDKLQNSKEYAAIVKLKPSNVEATIAKIKSLHSYDVPAIICINVETGEESFVDWVLG